MQSPPYLKCNPDRERVGNKLPDRGFRGNFGNEKQARELKSEIEHISF